MYSIMSVNNKSFVSSFSIPRISSSCLLHTIEYKLFSSISKQNCDRGQPCFIPDLREKTFTIYWILIKPINVMLAVKFLYLSFVRLRIFFFITSLQRFLKIMSGYGILSNAYSPSIVTIIYFILFFELKKIFIGV